MTSKANAKSYSVYDIAQAFIDIRKQNAKRYMTDTDMAILFNTRHLECFVFLANGIHQSITGVPLVNEAPRAWDTGPVFPSLHQTLKSIPDTMVGFNIFRHKFQEPGFMAKEIMELTYHSFARTKQHDLETMLTNTPMWINTWKKDKYGLIPQEDMDAFFSEVVNKLDVSALGMEEEPVLDANPVIDEFTVRIEYDEDGFIKNDFVKELTLQVHQARHDRIAASSDNENMAEDGLTIIRTHKDDYVMDVVFYPRTDFSYEWRLIDPDGNVHRDPTSWSSTKAAHEYGLHAIESIEEHRALNGKKTKPR